MNRLFGSALLTFGALLANIPSWSAAAYVEASQINAFQVLPSPPKADSEITRNDLTELHRLQSQRTPSQAMRAIADDKNETIFLFNTLLGNGFNPGALPNTALLSDKVHEDEGVNTDPAKSGFKRIRPYNLDKTLKAVCKTKTTDDSYPSGHTTTGYMLALTLIDMVPEMRDEILARADDYAHNRLVCGVHYPSDLPASRALAYAIHAAMSANPDYQRDLAAARQEVRSYLAPRLGSR